MKSTDLIGSWALQSFDISEEESSHHAWGYDAHGLLLYSASGHMSVAINRHAPWSEAGRPENPSEGTSRLLFYSGTYTFDSGTVYHQVAQASDPSRIGMVMIRKASLNGNLLTLIADGSGFSATLVRGLNDRWIAQYLGSRGL